MEKIESSIVDVMVDLSRVKETLCLVVSAGREEAGVTGQMLTEYPLLPGYTGDAVKVLQGLLYAAGYDPDGLDGKYGPGCTEVVRAFEADDGQDRDGCAGAQVVTALLANVAEGKLEEIASHKSCIRRLEAEIARIQEIQTCKMDVARPPPDG